MEANQTAEKTKLLASKGVEIVSPPPETMMNEFREVGKIMTAEWLKDTGADGKAIIDEFNKRRGMK